jgi:peptidoglycan/LPS O-acetylase OafA/YrhL
MTFNIKIADLSHLWSLAVEEHFYLIWPFLIFYLSSKTLLKVILGLILFSLLCRIYLLHLGYGTYYFTLANFDCMAVGAFLALFENHTRINKKNMFRIGLLTCTPLLLSFWFISGTGNDYVQYFKTLIVAIAGFAIIGYVIKSEDKKTIFNRAFLRYTGKISYGLYIFHPLCYNLINQYWHTDIFWIDLLISFMIVYIVATASFYLFELRFLAIKHKLILGPALLRV